jgi:hypothetical protein
MPDVDNKMTIIINMLLLLLLPISWHLICKGRVGQVRNPRCDLSHKHAHYSHSLSLSLSYSLSLSPTLSLSLSRSLSHTHTNTHREQKVFVRCRVALVVVHYRCIPG